LKKAANHLRETRIAAVRNICLIALILLLPSIASTIYAQNPSTTNPDIQLLLQKLKKRDAVIDDLNQRVKLLESKQQTPAPQQQTPSTSVAPANKAQSTDKPSPAAGPAQRTQTDPKSEDQTEGKSSAGSFDVDELAAERALDRSLIQTGALLLPFRQMEIQPFFNYIRREDNFPSLVTNNLGQLAGVRAGDIQRNEFDTGIFFRAGLPFESQLELRLPARIVDQRTVIPAGTTNVNETSRTGAALGDISVGIAKTLLREDGWIPDLVGRFTWDSDSGKINNNNVFMGTGFNEFRVSMTALKRQDPLAFTGRFDYQTTLKKNGFDRGDQYVLSLGASLAASPYTSLSLGLQQIWRQKTKFSNINVAGSDDVQSIMNFGVATRVTRKLFLIVNGGIGLTDASPDYLISVSLPFRLAY
jgi:outer membrane putative beta-barrel porin/alpha-amylase